jgi:ketosteroid isomerase-like protein
MASANIELVRSIYAAWERGDYSSAEWADSEIEYVIADGPAPGRWVGLTEMAEGVRDALNAWTGIRQEAEEYRELDDERVLVLSQWAGRGKTSGLELGQMRTRGVDVFHLGGGKVTRLVTYFEREPALVDLGLGTEAGWPGS